MNNPNDRTRYNREVRESHENLDGTTHTNVSRTTETVNNRADVPYRDGYVHGRATERRYQEDNLEVRDNDNAARGLLIGIILASLAGLVIGTLFFLNQRNEAPTQVIPIPAAPSTNQNQPNTSNNEPANQEPNVIERTIERTRDVVVPVPQTQPAPQPPASAPAPNINIEVPDTDAGQQQPPATQAEPAQPAPQTNNAPTGDAQTSPNSPAGDATGAPGTAGTTGSGAGTGTTGAAGQ